MRMGSRVIAVMLAAAVWIYAGMSVAPRPVAQQSVTPTALNAAAASVLSAVD
jgi:hypothetical protein